MKKPLELSDDSLTFNIPVERLGFLNDDAQAIYETNFDQLPVGKALLLLSDFAIYSTSRGETIDIDGESFLKTDPDGVRIIGSEFDTNVLNALLPAAQKRGKIEVRVFSDITDDTPRREILFFSQARMNVDQQLRKLSDELDD